MKEVIELALQKLLEMYANTPEKFKTHEYNSYNSQHEVCAGQYTMRLNDCGHFSIHLSYNLLLKIIKNDDNTYTINDDKTISFKEYTENPFLKIFCECYEKTRKLQEQKRCEETLEMLKVADKTDKELRAERARIDQELSEKKLLKKVSWVTIPSIRYSLTALLIIVGFFGLFLTISKVFILGWILFLTMLLHIENLYNKYVDYKNRKV